MCLREIQAAFLVTAFSALAPLAGAQCAHWSGGFEAPGFDGSIRAALVFDDGTGPALYVGGTFAHAAGIPATNVARWNGSTWSAVGAGIPGAIDALAVFDDGSGPRLLAGGELLNGASVRGGVVAWNGSQWTQLGGFFPPNAFLGDDEVLALRTFDDGSGARLYAGGSFEGAVRRFNGQGWELAGSGLFMNEWDDVAEVESFLAFDDGTGPALYASGRFQRVGSGSAPATVHSVARLAGTTWTAVGQEIGAGDVAALCAFDDGTGPALVAGGTFDVVFVTRHLARFVNGSWTAFAGDTNGRVTSLATIGAGSGVAPGLWAGGVFTLAGNVAATSIARFDGASWNAVGDASLFAGGALVALFDDGTGHGARAFGAGANGIVGVLDGATWTVLQGGGGADAPVRALCAVHGPGSTQELWAAGDFAFLDGATARGLARFDGVHWHAETLPGSSGTTRGLFALDAGAGEELYATGSFAGLGAGYRNLLRRTNGAWTVMPDVPVLSGYVPNALAVFDAGDGKHLYAGGPYGLWRLDGNAWSNLTGLLDYPVECLAVFDDGFGPALYMGGSFTHVGALAARSIARWDGHAFSDVGGGANANAPIYDLEPWDDGGGPALYACGSFNTLGSAACNCIGKWNGQSWSPVGGGLHGTYTSALALDVHDDGAGSGPALIVAGYFTVVGAQPAGRIASWNGSAWNTLDGGLDVGLPSSFLSLPFVRTLAVFDAGDGRGTDLYAGGNFEQAGAISSSCLARWSGCGGSATTFCYGDGSSTACPCGNASAVGDRAGCLSSLGIGGTLRTHGRASLGDDTLVLEGGSMPITSALYFQGANVANGGAGVVFGDGVKCTAGPFVRLGTKFNPSGSSSYPGPSDPRISLGGQITSAGTRYYQARYRNSAAFCTPDTFNYTSGVIVAWSP